MKRWLATAAVGLAAATGGAVAQQPRGGYFIVKVKVGGSDVVAPPAGGPSGGGIGSGGGPVGAGSGGGKFGLGGGPGAAGSGGGVGPAGGGPPPPNAGNLVSADDKSVVVLVPYTHQERRGIRGKGQPVGKKNPSWPIVTTEFGNTLAYDDTSTVKMFPMKDVLPNEAAIRAKHLDWLKKGGGTAAGLLDVVQDALAYDQVDLAVGYADQLVKEFDKEDARKDQRVTRFLVAYKQVKPRLTDPLPTDPMAAKWKGRLAADRVDDDAPHYSLVHYGDQYAAADARGRKVDQLERNLKGVYLWYATLGRALPLPEKKLVVVLAKKAGDLAPLRDKLDGHPVVADSFFTPEHNLLVLAPERTDDVGQAFLNSGRANYWAEAFNERELLKGDVLPALRDDLRVEDVARASTMALVDRLAERDANAAAVAREGTRQLLAAAGLLPRHVHLPDWLESGVCDLIDQPKNPGVVDLASGKKGLAVAVYTGPGSANYDALRRFRLLFPTDERNRRFAFTPHGVLLNTITDTYFAAAAAGGLDPDGPPLNVDPAAAGGIVGPGGPPAGGSAPPPGGIVPPPAGSSGPPVPPPGGAGKQGALPKNGPDEYAQGLRGGGSSGGAGSGRPIGPGPGVIGGAGSGGVGGTGGGIQPPGGALPTEADMKVRVQEKARVTAWALTFYLTKTRPDDLGRFYAELNKLPRDLKVDPRVNAELFRTAFGLTTDAAFNAFAADWLKYMKGVPQSWAEVTLDAATSNPFEGGGQPGGGPAVPGVPGGGPAVPGVPGGGPAVPGIPSAGGR